MATIGILLTHSPLQHPHADTAAALGEAALARGHQVRYFLFMDGTYAPNRLQSFRYVDTLSKDRFQRLLERGATVVACGLCAGARGLDKGRDYLEGVRVGGLADFSALVAGCDRLVAL